MSEGRHRDRERRTERCQTALASGLYVDGVRYALERLHAIPNVYTYLDAAWHGEIGWRDNFVPTAQLLAKTVRGTTAGMASVAGIVTNIANYAPVREPFVTIDDETRKSKWIDWNDYNEEEAFALAFRDKLVALGFDPGIGVVIDTSRDGWGGPNRPTKASLVGGLDERIDASRIDRRLAKSNWCNQKGSGLGERPRANPAPKIDAYAWIKPPGESDGSSELIPNDEGMGFDLMCDPWYSGAGRVPRTGALPDAPIAGAWFSAHFRELLANAYPPLPATP